MDSLHIGQTTAAGTVARRIRAAYRAMFAPYPQPRLDGQIIMMRAISVCASTKTPPFGAEWHRQAQIRGAQNQIRNAAWIRGELV